MYLHLCLKDWNSHRLNSMLRIVLALALFGVSPMLSQETVVSGRVTEMGITPSIIHVKKVIYPALQVADWTPEILVAENGSFDWNIGNWKHLRYLNCLLLHGLGWSLSARRNRRHWKSVRAA